MEIKLIQLTTKKEYKRQTNQSKRIRMDDPGNKDE